MSIEGKEYYRNVYLKSDKWSNLRLSVLVREHGRCQICGEESISNDAHHIWYPENIWDTQERHLVVLCRPCHEFVHIMVPECKTNDEEKGRQLWRDIYSAIIVWRRHQAALFTKWQWVLEDNPKQLRVQLAKINAELDQVKAAAECPLAATQMDPKKESMYVITTIKRWFTAYHQSVEGVKNKVE